MKAIFRILIIGIVLISCNGKKKKNEVKGTKIKVDKQLTESISNLIDSLYIVDQKIQSDLTQSAKKGEDDKMKELFFEQKKIFERHIPILKDIFNKIGYPTIELVGKENSSKYFTLVQHSDSDTNFQEDMLKEITREVKKGNVSGKNFAFLTDRVQLALEKPQIYGTQLNYNTNIGQAYPKNLLDSINVNKRRNEVGLESIEEYLNQVTKIHFQMNRAHYEKIGITKPKLYNVE